MISFGCMIAYSSTEILQIPASAAPVAAFLGVGATRLAADFAKHFCAPPLIRSLDALLELADGRDGIFAFAINIEATV
jgi:hypothetical protein